MVLVRDLPLTTSAITQAPFSRVEFASARSFGPALRTWDKMIAKTFRTARFCCGLNFRHKRRLHGPAHAATATSERIAHPSIKVSGVYFPRPCGRGILLLASLMAIRPLQGRAIGRVTDGRGTRMSEAFVLTEIQRNTDRKKILPLSWKECIPFVTSPPVITYGLEKPTFDHSDRTYCIVGLAEAVIVSHSGAYRRSGVLNS